MAKSKGRLLAELLSTDGTVKRSKNKDNGAAKDTGTATSNATTQKSIITFAKATYRSAKYVIQITNSTDSTYHVTELLLTHDGSTANITEYGTVYTGAAAEAAFSADISGSNVRLRVTPASGDTMAYKVILQTIAV
jgi:hypothetical protein